MEYAGDRGAVALDAVAAWRVAERTAELLSGQHAVRSVVLYGGLYNNLQGKFTWKDLGKARPQIFFQVLYPGLLAISIIAAAVLAATSTPNNCYVVQIQATPTASASSNGVIQEGPAPEISPGQQVTVCRAS
jgi:hypothetical protein